MIFSKTKGKELNEKKNYYYNIFSIIIIIIFLVLIGFTINSFLTPIKVKKNIETNIIEEKAMFDYKVRVKPSILYPSGGVIEKNNSILTEITKDVVVDFEYSIKSKKPINIIGDYKVYLYVISEGLWEKEFLLKGNNNIIIKNNDNKVIYDKIEIKLNEYINIIDEITEEIKASGNRVIVKIQPKIKGDIYYNDDKTPMKLNPELIFDYKGKYLSLAKDSSLKFENNESIHKTITKSNYISFLTKNISVKKARCIFSFLSIISLIIFIIIYRKKISQNNMSNFQKIDYRHKKRFINIKNKIEEKNLIDVYVKDMNKIIDISDEVEVPILRYENKNQIIYYLPHNKCLYKYLFHKKNDDSRESDI